MCAPVRTGAFVIPDGVKEICVEAFKGCGASSIIFSDSVELLNCNSLIFCHELKELTIPSTVKFTGGDAYFTVGWCANLEYVTLSADVLERDTLVSLPSLKYVRITDDVTSIGSHLFRFDKDRTEGIISLVIGDIKEVARDP